jgi:hypothetical protein
MIGDDETANEIEEMKTTAPGRDKNNSTVLLNLDQNILASSPQMFQNNDEIDKYI